MGCRPRARLMVPSSNGQDAGLGLLAFRDNNARDGVGPQSLPNGDAGSIPAGTTYIIPTTCGKCGDGKCDGNARRRNLPLTNSNRNPKRSAKHRTPLFIIHYSLVLKLGHTSPNRCCPAPPQPHVIISYSQSRSARRTVSTNALSEPMTVFERAKFA